MGLPLPFPGLVAPAGVALVLGELEAAVLLVVAVDDVLGVLLAEVALVVGARPLVLDGGALLLDGAALLLDGGALLLLDGDALLLDGLLLADRVGPGLATVADDGTEPIGASEVRLLVGLAVATAGRLVPVEVT